MMDSSFKDLLKKPYSEIVQENECLNPFGDERGQSVSISILDDRCQISGKVISIDGRIEEETKCALDAFNHVFRAAFKPHMTDFGLSLNQLDYERKSSPVNDYSMLVVELSKVLEIELNASIVLWMNRNLSKSIFEIDSKACGSSSMSIGQITHQIILNKDELEARLKYPFAKDIKIWKELRDSRNTSAHTGIVSEKEFVEYYTMFCEFVEMGWFTRLMDLKWFLRDK